MAQGNDTIIIQTHDLTHRYGKFTAIQGVNLTVRRGEIFGFLGPNGAGKTTTIRTLLDFIRPSAGSATIFGLDSVRDLIEKSLSPRLAKLSAETDLKDPKTRLQEFLQARHLGLPVYEVINTCGDEHNQSFEVSCEVPGLADTAKGVGNSRRKAEQAAAKQALKNFENHNE